MFYADKVSGQYHNHPAAARYVHQMAEEIILQLAGVASEIKKNRGEPEMHAQLLEEWEEHFPPSLGAIGTPKAIAALVQQQSRDLQKMRNELEAEKIHRDSDVSGILRSMDAQLHAYRSSVLHDRRQMQLLHEADLTALQEKMDTQQRLQQEAMQQLQDNHRSQMVQKRHKFEQQAKVIIRQKNRELQRVQKQLTQRLQQYRARIAVLQDRVITQKLTISDLRHKYHALARSFNEAVALSDTDSSDSEDTDSDLEDLDEDPAALGDLAHLLDDEDEDEDDDGKENGRSRASSLSSHPGDPAHKTAQGAGEDEWEAYIKNPLDRSPRHGDVDPVEGKDEDDILQALQELAAEKQQQRLLRAQRKQAIAAEKQRQEELAQDKASERRASRKKQKELERQDMQSFSKAVLAGDFASMGKCLLSRLPSATSPLTSDERPPRDLRLQRRRFRPNRRPKGTPPALAATRPCPRHCPPSC
jgi:hypothetical protein